MLYIWCKSYTKKLLQSLRIDIIYQLLKGAGHTELSRELAGSKAVDFFQETLAQSLFDHIPVGREAQLS